MEKMLEDFEHYCKRVKEIKLYTTERKIKVYNYQYELELFSIIYKEKQ